MTYQELLNTVAPLQNAGADAIATGAALLLAAALSGHRRAGRTEQDHILRQIVAEAWRMHDAGVAAAQAETGSPMGLRVSEGRVVN